MTGSKRRVQLVWFVLAVTLATLGIAFPTLAALGKISGSVKDKATGEGLPGVNVLIEGTKLGATTDLKGRYFVLNVPPGAHRVTVSIIGYKSETAEGVLIRSDVTTEVNFALDAIAVEVATPTVVIAERPPVDKTLTATRTSMGVEEINNTLPVDDIRGLIGTTAGTFRG
ncbi:MAG: carboxypeptidase-like regulatory domain-containing protein, partial [Candidatus Latescibacteria bacterium]|nr:carboxypeptidase-like regulatory domain-containing protein [Candidatus Latescibacterota bacterium]